MDVNSPYNFKSVPCYVEFDASGPLPADIQPTDDFFYKSSLNASCDQISDGSLIENAVSLPSSNEATIDTVVDVGEVEKQEEALADLNLNVTPEELVVSAPQPVPQVEQAAEGPQDKAEELSPNPTNDVLDKAMLLPSDDVPAALEVQPTPSEPVVTAAASVSGPVKPTPQMKSRPATVPTTRGSPSPANLDVKARQLNRQRELAQTTKAKRVASVSKPMASPKPAIPRIQPTNKPAAGSFFDRMSQPKTSTPRARQSTGTSRLPPKADVAKPEKPVARTPTAPRPQSSPLHPRRSVTTFKCDVKPSPQPKAPVPRVRQSIGTARKSTTDTKLAQEVRTAKVSTVPNRPVAAINQRRSINTPTSNLKAAVPRRRPVLGVQAKGTASPKTAVIPKVLPTNKPAVKPAPRTGSLFDRLSQPKATAPRVRQTVDTTQKGALDRAAENGPVNPSLKELREIKVPGLVGVKGPPVRRIRSASPANRDAKAKNPSEQRLLPATVANPQ